MKKKKEKKIKKNKKINGINRRISIVRVIFIFLFLWIIGRLFYLQVIKGNYYLEQAYNQQTREQSISATRGNIYDSSGENVLALSTITKTVNVYVSKIKDTEKDLETLSKDLAEILNISEEEILENLSKDKEYIELDTRVDEEKIEMLEAYIEEKDISYIKIKEEETRVYPYDNLLSHVLGFTGTDIQGLSGLEIGYETELKGVPGKIVGSVDTSGNNTPYDTEEYIAPLDGQNLILTVDLEIQKIVEKNLSKAVLDNKAESGVCVVMNPKTGEILAMASYPDFNPNDAFEINDISLQESWVSLDTSTKVTELNKMWRNKVISDTYEPGSTFKVLSASIAVEEDIVGMDVPNVFYCKGYEEILGWKIKCWRYPEMHGYQSLRQAIMNSCNPSFMQLSQMIGTEKYIEYLKAFNLYSTTGIDLPGEVAGIMHSPDSFSTLDLATTSFGQTIQITALQTAVIFGAVANGGNLVTPYIVKEITTDDGSVVKETVPVIKKQVISKQTAETVLSALYDTVESGSAKAAKIDSYSIAGKTGTGEQGRGDSLWYMASFVGIAPVSDPELVVVFNVHSPQGPNGNSGGAVCAPSVANIIDETLRYLNVNPNYVIAENTSKEVIVPDVINKTYAEAKSILTKSGLKIASDEVFEDEDLILEQIPKALASTPDGSTIRVYKSLSTEKETALVPDVRSKTVNTASSLIKNAGFNIRIVGVGNAIIQDPSPKTSIVKGSIITVKFVDTNDIH